MHAVASPLLVSIAEEGWLEGEVPEAIIRRYLDELLGKFPTGDMDCLLLGCTHFPVLAKTFARIAGPDIALVDSARTTAREVERVLRENNLKSDGIGQTRFLATDGLQRFARVGGVFLGTQLNPGDIELVDL